MDKLLDQPGVRQFAIYVMDFGGPAGFRLALWNPERLTAVIAQNARYIGWAAWLAGDARPLLGGRLGRAPCCGVSGLCGPV
jgi:pimeloyl-ACP methyl ester carboxylesterase